jgi:hypothetical protein
VSDVTVEAARNGIRLVVDTGREVGGPRMRENIRPLLVGDTERGRAWELAIVRK